MASETNQLPTPDLPAENYADNIGTPEPQIVDTPPPAAAQPQAEEGEPEAPKKWEDTKRNEIFNKAREKRMASTSEFSGDANDADARYGTSSVKDDMGDLERQAMDQRRRYQQGEVDAATGNQMAPQAQQRPLNNNDPSILNQRVRIKVDGVEQEITIEDAVRRAQMNTAADHRLSQANEILQQVKNLRQTVAQPGDGYDEHGEYRGQERHAADDDGDTSQQVDPRELVEKIQLGSTDEAINALETYVQSVIARNVPAQGDDATRVLTVLEDRNSEELVRRYTAANPDLINDANVTALVIPETHKQMVKDLMQAGYTEDQLRQNIQSPRDLANLHKQARISRIPGIRSADKIIEAAHTAVKQWRSGIAPGSAQAQPAHQAGNLGQREQRKANLQSQPAVRRQLQSAVPAAKSQEQSRASAVQRMRQMRGQAT